jgi:Domain of unknown function (DUF4062)
MAGRESMSQLLRKIRIFVASPGDVLVERDHLAKVIEELNLTLSLLAPEKGLVLELVRWETHVAPGLGRDAQDVVNQQIADAYDVFVGIMWKRFGTPTSVAGSGTEEEFQRAYRRWAQDPKIPVLFYFCQKPFPPPRTIEDSDQLGKVVRFHVELSSKGLVGEYPDPESFADIVRRNLLLVLSRSLSPTMSPVERIERSRALVLDSAIEQARRDLSGLAAQYERVRATMGAGDDRTRVMAGISSRMRALAVTAYPLLPELTSSASPGSRLAAIAILREIPDAEYLEWLAHRPATETPFVGYQATMALLQAARVLPETDKPRVAEAVRTAQAGMKTLDWQDPAQVAALRNAEQELARRNAVTGSS